MKLPDEIVSAVAIPDWDMIKGQSVRRFPLYGFGKQQKAPPAIATVFKQKRHLLKHKPEVLVDL
jgi:hypothetical protein